MKTPCSIYDVARRARISTATVSLVINSKGKISEKTRRRVLAVCAKLNYRPHPTARLLPKLRHGNQNAIHTGLYSFTPVIATGLKSAYTGFLDGVAEVSLVENKMVVYQPFNQEREPHAALCHAFGIDARLIVGLVDDKIVDFFQEQGVPLVIMGDHSCQRLLWNVNLDCHAAGRMAVEHLWNLGHRRLALFCQCKTSLYQTDFKRGFEDALLQKGLTPQDYDIIGTVPSGDEVVDLLRRTERRPTALVAVEGGRAQHTIMRSREIGLKIPGDLSLLGFGHLPAPQYDQRVTHLDPCHEEIGRCGMELAIRLSRKEQSDPPARTLITPKMVKGETCASI
ncbi:MAG: LacI family DNA-binding transcriptional regulator [Verrucomicrobia bacterium]|nr:LacI family DNA-binding transcriptional regulator [Verrucomicrobiota bacterium]